MKASAWTRLGWKVKDVFSSNKDGWNDVIKAAKKQAKTDANKPHNTQQADGRVSPSVYVANAISWAADLHPNGREPSSHVKVIEYKGDKDGTLLVTFRDGTIVEYKNIDYALAKAFVESDSKGRFVNRRLAGLKYRIV